jgi:hypothetical protein
MSAIRLAMLSVCLTVLSPLAVKAGPIMEWLCGCSSNMTSQSTYAPAYVPTAVVAAPAAGCSCAPQQTTYYAPAVAYPAAVTAYRPFLPIVPRPTTTYYRPPAGYNPYSLAPVTVYRPVVPVQPVVTTTRLIPYTSYRMVYPATVSYYGVAPAYYAYPEPPPCAVPESGAPVENYNPPPAGSVSEGDATEIPSLPPGQPATTFYPPLESAKPIIVEKPIVIPPPANGQESKPATGNEPKQAPKGDGKDSGAEANPANPANPPAVQKNSLTNPPRDESQDRTTRRPVRQISRAASAATQPTVQVLSGDLWRPAKD